VNGTTDIKLSGVSGLEVGRGVWHLSVWVMIHEGFPHMIAWVECLAVDFFCAVLQSFSMQNCMHVLMLSACYCLILTKIGMCWQILVKLSSIKFHENTFRSSQIVCRQVDMAKLIGDFFVALLQMCLKIIGICFIQKHVC
jgi:hypothetical protein